MTANRATDVTFGEGGEEGALFFPMNGRWSLAQFAAMLSGQGQRGGGGGGGAQQLDVNLRVTADQNFSPAFEDALLGKIADIVVEVLPRSRVNR